MSSGRPPSDKVEELLVLLRLALIRLEEYKDDPSIVSALEPMLMYAEACLERLGDQEIAPLLRESLEEEEDE